MSMSTPPATEAISIEDYHRLQPIGAPPLLTTEQLNRLCSNGWLDFDLPGQLQDDITQLQSQAASFFQQDSDTKIKALGSWARELEEEGYYNVSDEKEYITLRREVAKPPALQATVKQVWKTIAAILHRILCDMSKAGGLDPAAWEEVIKGTLTLPHARTDLQDSPTLLRLFRYEPATGTAAKHTDLGLLTMCVGTCAGLQCLDQSQYPAVWIGAPQCTVLVGETLRKLSSDNIRAGVHRVIANPVGRQSLVFAMRPNLRAIVDLNDFGGQGSVNLRGLFTSIKGSKYNVNAKREIQELQQMKTKIHKGRLAQNCRLD